MNEASAGAFLNTEPLGALMRKYAVPCVISLLVAALYNIVDQIFIANASYLGSYGQRRQHRGVSPDGGGPGRGRDDRGQLLRLCEHLPGARNRESVHRSIGGAVVACHGGHLEYGAQIQRPGRRVRPGAIRSDPHGGFGHCHEIFSDRHFRRHPVYLPHPGPSRIEEAP